jgi:hypothetical protein
VVKNSPRKHAALAAISSIPAQEAAKPQKYVVTTIDAAGINAVIWQSCTEQWE